VQPQAPSLYLDACATTPPAGPVLEAMASAQASAWANPSSLHGFGLEAAELLERSRLSVAGQLDCDGEEVVFTSGGSESIHLALLGAAAALAPGRLLISAVEHPATLAAARQLEGRGWRVETLPVDRQARLDLEALDRALRTPAQLVSVIWGHNEVGTIQPLATIGERCRAAGALLHVDAVQVVGHQPLSFRQLPVDLLSFTAHKLQGPRGIGGLLVRSGLELGALIGGGGQERGRRGGTEPVVLAAGMARALELGGARLDGQGGDDPLRPLRDALLGDLLALPGIRLTGADPTVKGLRLPHHISLLVSDGSGRPVDGRELVRHLWQEGIAISSGSACSSSRGGSTVLQALGYSPAEAASSIRISLGPWIEPADLQRVPLALERARQRCGPEQRLSGP
jgi:cysteine desulfurase